MRREDLVIVVDEAAFTTCKSSSSASRTVVHNGSFDAERCFLNTFCAKEID